VRREADVVTPAAPAVVLRTITPPHDSRRPDAFEIRKPTGPGEKPKTTFDVTRLLRPGSSFNSKIFSRFNERRKAVWSAHILCLIKPPWALVAPPPGAR
jgi:hypothetical protein